jgi:hypothetical protein
MIGYIRKPMPSQEADKCLQYKKLFHLEAELIEQPVYRGVVILYIKG